MWKLSLPAVAPARPDPLAAARHRLASGLLRLSSLLLHAAVRLQWRPLPSVVASATPEAPEAGERPLASLEYHADAGAPEGALYADGRLVGWLHGVARL